jgi:hypothetical protein
MGREEGHLPESDRDESARLTPIESQSTPTTRWHSLAGFLLRWRVPALTLGSYESELDGAISPGRKIM